MLFSSSACDALLLADLGLEGFSGDFVLQSSLLEDSLLPSTCDSPVQASSSSRLSVQGRFRILFPF